MNLNSDSVTGLIKELKNIENLGVKELAYSEESGYDLILNYVFNLKIDKNKLFITKQQPLGGL